MTTLLALTYTLLFVAGVFATVAFGMAILRGAFLAFDRAGARVPDMRP
jgi:hypothetical protein